MVPSFQKVMVRSDLFVDGGHVLFAAPLLRMMLGACAGRLQEVGPEMEKPALSGFFHCYQVSSRLLKNAFERHSHPTFGGALPLTQVPRAACRAF
jgi:hypothetical protein